MFIFRVSVPSHLVNIESMFIFRVSVPSHLVNILKVCLFSGRRFSERTGNENVQKSTEKDQKKEGVRAQLRLP